MAESSIVPIEAAGCRGRELRRAIYRGRIFKAAADETSLQLAHEVNVLLEAAFGEEPRRTSHAEASDFLERLANVRGALTEQPQLAQQAQAVMDRCGLGLAAGDGALDHPRLRAVAPGVHHIPEAAAVYFAHRDTWYANPQSQINWWVALHDAEASVTFRLFPRCFDVAIANDSAAFDYRKWVEEVGWQRAGGAALGVYPRATEELDEDGAVGFSCRRGEVVIFSAAQLHRTRRNCSERIRLSVDFRSVHLGDHEAGLGAPNTDNASRGLALVDYPRL